jgi:hypothetical protein
MAVPGRGPARLGVRPGSASACRSSAPSSPPRAGRARPTPGDGPSDQLVQRRDQPRRPAVPRPRPPSPSGWRPRPRHGHRHSTSCATGCSPASATGASRSRSSTTRRPAPRSPTRSCPVLLPEIDDYSPADPRGRRDERARAAAGPGRGVGQVTSTWATARGVPPRAEHHAAVGRVVLVRAALPRPHQRERLRRPRGRALLDGSAVPDGDCGGVDLYVGRRGARRAAPAVRPVLAQGAVRPRHVSSSEPFRRLFNQGYIQAYAYTDERGIHVEAFEVTERDGGRFFHDGEEVTASSGRWARA